MRPRIVVTGCGLVTALGAGVEATWSRLLRGEGAIVPLTLFDTTGYRSRVAAEVRSRLEGDPADPSWSRSTGLALEAAREALSQAGLSPGSLPSRTGLVAAGTVGGMFETEDLLARFHADPGSREVLSRMLSHPLTATGDRLERELGPFTRVRTLSSACSSGANAIVVGATWLELGLADVVLAGASDALCRLTFSGFNALSALDPEPCRPFDKSRRGLSLGEGAAFVVLERAGDARARGAKALVEVAGWAVGSEAHHVTNPESSGAVPARLIGEALARARLSPRYIDYVNAHGTGTPLNDAMETAALAAALGSEVSRVRVSSCKGQIGHTLAAAGAIEAIVTALALAHRTAPPTVGLTEPETGSPLQHVMGKAAPVDGRAALSNSFGFGGMDTVLVLTAPGYAPDPLSQRARRPVITGAFTLGARLPLVRVDEAEIAGLDPSRGRRLDRTAALGVVVAERALAHAGGAPAKERAGLVLGCAFGSVDGSSAYMYRLVEKGPRLASPADFPNLVPSAPAGHASIYLGRKGPTLTVMDLAASGEASLAQALELVLTGEADQVVAEAVEEASDIVERVLVALFAGGAPSRAPRSEGAGAVVVEDETTACARGANVIARIEGLVTWRHGAPQLPPPGDARAPRVVLATAPPEIARLLDASAWRDVPRVDVSAQFGEHEALGAISVSEAALAIASGAADRVLVLSSDVKRGYALVLARP